MPQDDYSAHDPWNLSRPLFVDCRQPHSFYDFVEWCTKGTTAQWPVSRICNIVRKRQQILKSKELTEVPVSVVVEPLAQAPAGSFVDDELIARKLGCHVTSSLLRASIFLATVGDEGGIRPGLQDQYQGYFILKRVMPQGKDPFGHMFESVLSASPGLLNNYVHVRSSFSQSACGCNFGVNGSYFAQQNTVSTVCAHDSLLSALMSLANGPAEPAIRRQLHESLATAPGIAGPGLDQMVDALHNLGVSCKVQDLRQAAQPEDYRGLVYATVESGYPAIIVFTTSHGFRHAITVVGHTLNSDTWVPEVEFGYGSVGSSPKYHTTYDWAPHWIINDGNLGMYYCLEPNRLRLDAGAGHVAAGQATSQALTEPLKAEAVIGLYETDSEIIVANAETKVAQLLSNVTTYLMNAGPISSDPQSKWLWRLLCTCSPKDLTAGPILRIFQTTRSIYLKSLFEEPDWNNQILGPDERKVLAGLLQPVLPDRIWICEFTLVHLFTANRRKLGEVVFSGSWSNTRDLLGPGLHFVRLPGIAWLPGTKQSEKLCVTAHTRIIRSLSTSRGQPEY
jgi:hypothetical protein